AAERWYLSAVNRRRLTIGFVGVLFLIVVGWEVYLNGFLPPRDQELESRRFSAERRKRAPAPARVLFFRTEAHAAAFPVRRPLDIFVEGEKLDAWAASPEPHYVVMPVTWYRECGPHLQAGRLEPILTSDDLPGSKYDKPLVLLRTRPPAAAPRADESVD